MSPKRCPACGQIVLVSTTGGPSVITISPCGHKIGHIAELLDAPALDPLSLGDWLTEFLATADDN